MKQDNYYQFVRIIHDVFKHLPKKRQYQFLLLFTGMIVLALLEILSAGTLALFATAALNPTKILESDYITQLQSFVNVGLLNDLTGILIILSVVVVLVLAIKNIMQGLVIYYSTLYGGYSAANLAEKLLAGFLFLPYEWHLSRNSADLILAVTWRAKVNQLLKASLKVLSDVLIVVFLLLGVVAFKPVVSIPLMGVVSILAILFFFKFRKFLDRTARKLKDYRVAINRQVHKSMHGFKDIKVYGREAHFNRDFKKQVFTEARLKALQDVLPQCPAWIMEVVAIFLICFLVCLLFLVMKTSSVYATGYIAFLAAVARSAIPKISQIVQGFSKLRINLPYLQTNLEYLEIIDGYDIKDPVRHIPTKSFQRAVDLSGVSFQYKETKDDVLKNINFSILKGKTIGVVGTSGAGKSTLVDLVIGLLSPTQGAFTIDGEAPGPDMIRSWMRNIGYVPQDPYMCPGTLAENIAFGYTAEEIDRDRVIECCRMAAMDDFLWKLPQGIDTQIGERGVKLSGGQNQRVAIARALYHGPEILVFDEATSSLDTQSEKAIQKTIYSFKGKQTLLIVAHRLSTVQDCDEIIWLEDGKVKKIDVPEEILPEYKASMTEETHKNDLSICR